VAMERPDSCKTKKEKAFQDTAEKGSIGRGKRATCVSTVRERKATGTCHQIVYSRLRKTGEEIRVTKITKDFYEWKPNNKANTTYWGKKD